MKKEKKEKKGVVYKYFLITNIEKNGILCQLRIKKKERVDKDLLYQLLFFIGKHLK